MTKKTHLSVVGRDPDDLGLSLTALIDYGINELRTLKRNVARKVANEKGEEIARQVIDQIYFKYFLFLERGSAKELAQRNDVLYLDDCPVTTYTPDQIPCEVYDQTTSPHNRRLRILIPKYDLELFLYQHGGLPNQGLDVVMLVDTRVGAKEDTAAPIVCFPSVTEIDTLDQKIPTIATIVLGYLKPRAISDLKAQTFYFR